MLLHLKYYRKMEAGFQILSMKIIKSMLENRN